MHMDFNNRTIAGSHIANPEGKQVSELANAGK